jgi:hypothetical protein
MFRPLCLQGQQQQFLRQTYACSLFCVRMQRRRANMTIPASADADQPSDLISPLQPPADSNHNKEQQQMAQPTNKWQKLRDMINSNGPGAFFAYITVSNLLSVGTLSSAWLIFTRSTGQTPLQAWPQFLACYAGVYAAQHLARPYKIAVGLAAAPFGTAAVKAATKLFRVSSKAALVALLLIEAVLLLSCLGCVVLYASHLVS